MVVGMAKSGIAAAELLREKGALVSLVDQKPATPEVLPQEAASFAGAELLVLSPGVPADLPLIEDVKSALVQRAGPIGQALSCVLAYEQTDWENVQFEGLSPTAVREIYMEAIAWAGKLSIGLTK